jgi:hypothetical protein
VNAPMETSSIGHSLFCHLCQYVKGDTSGFAVIRRKNASSAIAKDAVC